jgi:hypothetical protein
MLTELTPRCVLTAGDATIVVVVAAATDPVEEPGVLAEVVVSTKLVCQTVVAAEEVTSRNDLVVASSVSMSHQQKT